MAITLDQARDALASGRTKVAYRAPYPNAAPEEGVITSVSDRFVFVRYGNGFAGVATDPDGLEFAAPGATP